MAVDKSPTCACLSTTAKGKLQTICFLESNTQSSLFLSWLVLQALPLSTSVSLPLQMGCDKGSCSQKDRSGLAHQTWKDLPSDILYGICILDQVTCAMGYFKLHSRCVLDIYILEGLQEGIFLKFLFLSQCKQRGYNLEEHLWWCWCFEQEKNFCRWSVSHIEGAPCNKTPTCLGPFLLFYFQPCLGFSASCLHRALQREHTWTLQ